MHPIFFGSSQQQLYGVYHSPRVRAAADRAVVLCYPFGAEYLRAHRAFRQLATLLSRNGFHVLRFDYRGTGDSGGDGEDGNLQVWLEDVGLAIDELKDTAGIDQVSLIGLRLGGSLAAIVATQREDLDQVILWDPVTDGSAYVADLLSIAGVDEESATVVGVHGFPLTSGLRSQLGSIDLLVLPSASAGQIQLIVSEPRPDWLRLRDHMADRWARFAYQCVPSPNNWSESDEFGSALLPQTIIRQIVLSVAGEVVR